MRKKFFVISSVLLIALLLFLGSQIPNNGFLRQDNLSPRAKQYISQRQSQQKVEWIGIEDESSNTQGGARKKAFVDECYEIAVPHDLENVLNTGLCSRRLFLSRPHGEVTIVQRFLETSKPNDVPDIQMRRALSDTYSESQEEINGVEYLIFSKKEQSSGEKTAFRITGKSMVAITYLSSSALSTIEGDFLAMLESFQCKFSNCYPNVSAANPVGNTESP